MSCPSITRRDTCRLIAYCLALFSFSASGFSPVRHVSFLPTGTCRHAIHAASSKLALRDNNRLLGTRLRVFKDLQNAEELDPAKTVLSTLETLKSLDSGDVDISTMVQELFPSDEGELARYVTKKLVEKGIETTEDQKLGKETIRTAIGILGFLLKSADDAKADLGYTTYPRHPEYPDVDLSHMMKMLDGVPPLEYFFSPKKTLKIIKRTLRMSLGLVLTKKDVDKAATAEEKYRAIFGKERIFKGALAPLNLVPLPKYTYKHWQDDKYVAYQFLNGVNPVSIQVVKDVDAQLSSELREYFGEDSLKDKQDAKRLLFVSYDDVAQLKVNPHMSYPDPPNESPNPPDGSVNGPQFFQGPTALFELSEDRGELDILGIQLYRELDAESWQKGQAPMRKVYTKDNTEPDEWLFVKTCLTNADSQVHEWVSHLGKTHFTMEPHIIAIHNTLRKNDHPVYTFVRPMCRDTLLLNWAARRTLASFGKDSFGDYMTSVGTGQFMQLIQTYWKDYDFFGSSALPRELESRGFDQNFDIPCYLFRNDGLKLWEAYGEFAANFVDELYHSDEEVKNDKVLLQWAIETVSQDKANIPGFPESFPDKKTLAYTLQTLGYMSGCQHAAVNYPQYEYYAYQANKPLHLRGQLPNQAEIHNKTESALFEDNLPDMNRLQTAIETTNTLTTPSLHNLDQLESNFEEIGTDAYSKFLRRLEVISDEIEERNDRLTKEKKQVYNYLNPAVVPASIDI